MAASDESGSRAMRAADADREKIAAELRVHCVAGRITVEELDQRVQRAMSAVTLAQLAELVADLPVYEVPSRPAAYGRPPRVGPPGVLPFTQRLMLSSSLTRAYDLTLDTIAPGLNAMGYALVIHSPDSLVFERRSRSPWRVVFAVLLFPVGLLALIGGGRCEQIVISFEARGAARTHMKVHGTAPRRVRKQFAALAVP